MSLVELLISVAILSVMVYAIVSLFPASLLYLRRTHDALAASQVAQQVVEQLRASQFSSSAASPTTQMVQAGTLFQVASAVSYDYPDCKRIVVTVSWPDGVVVAGKATTRSLTLQTSVFQVKNP